MNAYQFVNETDATPRNRNNLIFQSDDKWVSKIENCCWFDWWAMALATRNQNKEIILLTFIIMVIIASTTTRWTHFGCADERLFCLLINFRCTTGSQCHSRCLATTDHGHNFARFELTSGRLFSFEFEVAPQKGPNYIYWFLVLLFPLIESPHSTDHEPTIEQWPASEPFSTTPNLIIFFIEFLF